MSGFTIGSPRLMNSTRVYKTRKDKVMTLSISGVKFASIPAKGSDAGTQYFCLSCWATSRLRFGKGDKIFDWMSQPRWRVFSHVRAGMVCGHKMMMMMMMISVRFQYIYYYYEMWRYVKHFQHLFWWMIFLTDSTGLVYLVSHFSHWYFDIVSFRKLLSRFRQHKNILCIFTLAEIESNNNIEPSCIKK